MKDLCCPKCGEVENIHVNLSWDSKDIDGYLCNECGEWFENKLEIMDRIIDYKMLSSLSDDMKKVLVDVALEAYLDGLSDGVNIEAGLASENSGKFISELAKEIEFKL